MTTSLRFEVLTEPRDSEARDLFERPGLLEQMRCAGHDLEPGWRTHLTLRLLVQFDDLLVESTDDQQCRRLHPGQRIAGQVRTSAARDDCARLLPPLSRGDE